MLDVARRVPSAGFSQGVDFLVLDEPAALGRFWALVEDPQFPVSRASSRLLRRCSSSALADPGRYVERYSRPDKIAFGLDRADAWPVRFWDTDTAMACMVLLLAAVDAGLGGWFFGIGYGETEGAPRVRHPDDRNIVGVVGLGYAGVDTAPRGSAYSLHRRDFDEQIHRNRW